ncbi:MAG: transcription antitermination factor NusB [Phycisphaerales bacterium]|nr:transcription antitermination factor NusB [Phycisphaerales bacterium]
MSAAHEQRCCALQAMFQFDLGGTRDLAQLRESFEARAREDRSADPLERECDFTLPSVALGMALAERAWALRGEADEAVRELAPEWPTHRQPSIDRNILRLGYWEIKHGGVPIALAIDEAVELAKSYSTEKSSAFINGVLDRIANPVAPAEGDAIDGCAPQGEAIDAHAPEPPIIADSAE